MSERADFPSLISHIHGGSMKSLIALALSFSALFSYAETIQTEVVDVEQMGSEHVLFAGDGQIYRLHSEKDIADAINAKELGLKVTIELDETYNTTELLEQRNNIIDIRLTSEATMQSLFNSIATADPFAFQQKDYSAADLFSSYISDFDSEYEVESLFRTMRTDLRSKSQCYNRAHVWSYELHRRRHNGRRIQTGKMWLFFTRRYIRDYDYKWWFHIAPYLNVQGQPRVIDRTFAYNPQDERTWTNMFMQNNAACRQVTKYTDYRNNQNSAYCYTIKTSVFYWQPWQIEGLEKNGQVRNGWHSYEVRKAYKNAVGWRARVPSLD